MAIITIEMGPDKPPFKCECCGEKSQTVHGFVYSNDNAHAVYYAGWSEGHPDQGVCMAISVGEWGDGADPANRRCVTMDCRIRDDQFQFSVFDADQSSWSDVAHLGEKLSRNAALSDPQIGVYFHIAEHIISDDIRVVEYLEASTKA